MPLSLTSTLWPAPPKSIKPYWPIGEPPAALSLPKCTSVSWFAGVYGFAPDQRVSLMYGAPAWSMVLILMTP